MAVKFINGNMCIEHSIGAEKWGTPPKKLPFQDFKQKMKPPGYTTYDTYTILKNASKIIRSETITFFLMWFSVCGVCHFKFLSNQEGSHFEGTQRTFKNSNQEEFLAKRQTQRYCSVLLKWEFFIKMRAYYLQPSSVQYSCFLKEGGSKAGSSHFNKKFSF